MEKYYTPSSEELRVGFECEIKLHTSEWKPIRLTEESMKTIYSSVDIIRVKYLDKEDIESFGFNLKVTDLGEDTDYDGLDIYDKNKSIIGTFYLDTEKENVEIYNTIFTIKNKSELEALLKQLGIRDNEEC